MAVAARPVHWHDRLATVALVVVPHRDRAVLSPQLGHTTFERIPTGPPGDLNEIRDADRH